MKKVILWITFLMIFAQMSFISPEKQEVTVKFVIGQVEYSRKGETERQKITLNTKLNEGDQIITKNESRVELVMFDETIMKIGERSLFTIEKMSKEADNSSMVFGLRFGSIWAKFSKLVSGSSDRSIKTPTAVCAVRGTEFGVEVDNKTGKTSVFVKTGKVAVRDNNGQGEVDVKENQQTVIEKGGKPMNPFKFDPTTRSESSNNTNSNEIDKNKPEIKLQLNLNNRLTRERQFTVLGGVFDKTKEDVIQVFVNDNPVARITEKGGFRHLMNLLEGENLIVVMAKDKVGNASVVDFKIFLDSVKPFARIVSGLEPIIMTRNPKLGDKPPLPPGSRFVRNLRGFVQDPDPSSGIKSVKINGREVQLKPDKSFNITFELTLDQVNQLILQGKNLNIQFEVEDLAGNRFIDNSNRIRIF